jgi:NAD+ synthase
MTDQIRIACVQANPTLGAIAKNEAKARDFIARAKAEGADLVVFPEMFLLGYPPEDLALKPAAAAECKIALERLAGATADGPAVLMGVLWAGPRRKPYNAVALLNDGKVADVSFKVDLPNYGVFDERRVFEAGEAPKVFHIAGVRIGAPICEDIWTPAVCAALKAKGAEIIVSPNGSPYRFTADTERMEIAAARVRETGLPLVYVNQVGGQDELVFDGGSFSLNPDGAVVQRLPLLEEAFEVATWRRGEGGWSAEPMSLADWPKDPEESYRAMVVGLRDYVEKSGFPGVILGMSGGIDSAITAVVASDALGAHRVRCVMMPSRYTSTESLEDAEACAKNLGCPYETISIVPAIEGFETMLAPVFAGRDPDTTEENLQSRARGMTLMALSNKFGDMVMTTGNKSEMAVGYATLYGDMCGGYNVLKDVWKTDVFDLAKWRNANDPFGSGLAPIPERIITKPPSAELRPDQKDEDSLPPYDVLDGILKGLVEEEATLDDIVARGYPAADVERVQRLLYGSEYKRRQAPPGVKLGARAFGRDRRYPIVNGFRDVIHKQD